jgi:hypothetical protein
MFCSYITSCLIKSEYLSLSKFLRATFAHWFSTERINYKYRLGTENIFLGRFDRVPRRPHTITQCTLAVYTVNLLLEIWDVFFSDFINVLDTIVSLIFLMCSDYTTPESTEVEERLRKSCLALCSFCCSLEQCLITVVTTLFERRAGLNFFKTWGAGRQIFIIIYVWVSIYM